MSPDTTKVAINLYDYNRLSISDRPHRECFFCGRRATHEVYAGRASSTCLYLCDRHLGNLEELLVEHDTKEEF